MTHDFGRTLEKFSKADTVNSHTGNCLGTIEGGSDSMVAGWKQLSPEMVILAIKKYLIQTASPYNIIRIT